MTATLTPEKPIVKGHDGIRYPSLASPEKRQHLAHIIAIYGFLLERGAHSYADLCQRIERYFDTRSDTLAGSQHRANLDLLKGLARHSG